MAINFTVSYTFSSGNTISSSQVNTNTSDNANVWTGLEALTKSFAKLKVDVDPTTALEVATKQYTDHYSTYRRPVLQYSSATVVIVETGLDGTSGDCTILFPDGNLRTDTSTGRIQCNLAQVAALSGSWQSGLRTGSVAANTWYAVYAVKTSDNTSHWVAVADTVLPVQGSYATLNSNFGTSSWVYLGLVRTGDQESVTTSVISFVQAGNTTYFTNAAVGTAFTGPGIGFADTASGTSLTYTYSAGTLNAQIPAVIAFGVFTGGKLVDSTSVYTKWTDSGGGTLYGSSIDSSAAASICVARVTCAASQGMKGTTSGAAQKFSIFFSGFVDGVLGVGSNPLL